MILTFTVSMVFLSLPGPVFHNWGGVHDQVPHQRLTLSNAVTITWPSGSIDSSTAPEDFRGRTGPGFNHLNIRSLLPKLDVKIWT